MKKMFMTLAATLALAASTQAGIVTWDVYFRTLPVNTLKYDVGPFTAFIVLNEGENKLNAANSLLNGKNPTDGLVHQQVLNTYSMPTTPPAIYVEDFINFNYNNVWGVSANFTLFIVLPVKQDAAAWGDDPEWVYASDEYSAGLVEHKFIFFDINGVVDDEYRDVFDSSWVGFISGYYQPGSYTLEFIPPDWTIVAIPEPATGILALAGGAMLLMRRRRK